MNLQSLGEHASGPLALLCAVAVFLAAAFDAQNDVGPVAATLVQVAP